MKYKVAFRKNQSCFLFLWLLCLALTVTGCALQAPKEEIQNTKEAEELEQTPAQQKSEEEIVPERTVSELYYAYHTLDEKERVLYLEVLDALVQRKSNVAVSTVKPQLLKSVFTCVMNDHPELFYVEGYQYTKYSVGDTITSISFYGTYSMTQEEVFEKQKEIDAYVNLCLAGMPQTQDEYVKAKYLYDYLIAQTEYDTDVINNQNICSVFIEKRSVCQGYAKALQYLMQKAGMVSMLVTGFTEQEGHAWNLVRVNGAYYYTDVTWGDAAYTFGEEGGAYAGELPPINYDYFLVTTQELLVTHIPDDTIKLPECTATEDNYYIREDLYLETYDEDRLCFIFERALSDGLGFVTFRCSDEEAFDTVRTKLIEQQEVFRFLAGQGESVAYTDNRRQRTISFWL